jgi:Galactose oxidase, central domain
MFYSTALDAMFYVSGAQRFLNNGTLTTVDYNTTWMYSFTGPTAKSWVRKADLPYASNHMMAVTAKDATGKERHYAFGGQYQENEYGGNYANMYEYNVASNKWTQQSNLPFARAHASSSTLAVGCGIVVVGGNTNGGQILANVTYYHTPTKSWIQLGTLPVALNTPVCAMNRWTSVLHCETGKLGRTHSYQRQLLLSNV